MEYYVISDGELLEIIEERPDLQALADEHERSVWVIRGETIGEASPRPARSETIQALKEQAAKLRAWKETVEGMVR